MKKRARKTIVADVAASSTETDRSDRSVFSTGRPWFQALIGGLVALTIFLSGEQNERIGVANFLSVLWLLAAVFWLLLPVLKGDPLPKLSISRFDWIVYGFFAWSSLAILWNLLPGQGGAPRSSLNMLSVWLALASLWFLLRQTMEREVGSFALIAVLLGVVFSQSSVGLYQQFVDIPRMIRQFDADPVGTVRLADPSIEPGTPAWDRMESRIRTAVPTGTYPLSNTLGGFLGCGLILAAGLYFQRENRFSRSGGLFLLLIFGLFFCFILVKCRSAYVAVAVGLVFLAWNRFHERRKAFEKKFFPAVSKLIVFAVVLGMFALGMIVLAATSGKAILSGATRSLGYRVEYWTASLDMIRGMPVFGCGSGNFKQTYTKYKLPGASEEIADPHNFAIEIAATSGLPALLLFLVVIVSLSVIAFRFHSMSRNDRDAESPDRNEIFRNKVFDGTGGCLCGGAIGCWLAFFLSYLTEAPMDFAAPVLASVAFAVTAVVLRQTDSSSCRKPVSNSLVFIVMVVLLVHLLAAGGISVTNTASVFWLLAATLASHSEFSHNAAFSNDSSIRREKTIRFFVPAMLVVFLFLINHFNLRPMLGSFSPLIRAEQESDPRRRIALFEEAAEADPYSATLRDRIASEYFAAFSVMLQTVSTLSDHSQNKNRADETVRSFEQNLLQNQEKALELSPRSAMFRFAAAERMNFLYRQTGKAAYRDRALRWYEEAVNRYPNYARFRAPWAMLLWEIGEKDAALRQREIALRLDDQMHHADQKLAAQQKTALQQLGETDAP